MTETQVRAGTPPPDPNLLDPPLAMAGMFALALLPLLATPVLPLIDFYNHLARFFVLSHLHESAVLQAHYAAHWALLPDVGVDVVGVPLLAVLPPMAAGHVIAALLMGNLYAAALYFHRRLTGAHSLLVAVLLLPLLYSYVFNWGFSNFLMGLGLAFWAAGWWIAHRGNQALSVAGSCVWSLLIFFSHGIAFVLYGVLVAALEVGFFLQGSERTPLLLLRRLMLVAVQAILPVTYFLFWKFGLAGGAKSPSWPTPRRRLFSRGWRAPSPITSRPSSGWRRARSVFWIWSALRRRQARWRSLFSPGGFWWRRPRAFW